jgi:hypothetical protein
VAPYLLAPLFGLPPGAYTLHHCAMHHTQGNAAPGDASSTEPYQRDSAAAFLRWGRVEHREGRSRAKSQEQRQEQGGGGGGGKPGGTPQKQHVWQAQQRQCRHRAAASALLAVLAIAASSWRVALLQDDPPHCLPAAVAGTGCALQC